MRTKEPKKPKASKPKSLVKQKISTFIKAAKLLEEEHGAQVSVMVYTPDGHIRSFGTDRVTSTYKNEDGGIIVAQYFSKTKKV